MQNSLIHKFWKSYSHLCWDFFCRWTSTGCLTVNESQEWGRENNRDPHGDGSHVSERKFSSGNVHMLRHQTGEGHLSDDVIVSYLCYS